MAALRRDFRFENSSFDEWLRATFDDPAIGDDRFVSFFLPETPEGAQTVLKHCTHLFRDPAFLLDQYHQVNLSKVLWSMPGIDGDMSCLCCGEIPLEIRIECIQSMSDLFGKLFGVPRASALEGACFMWWELLQSAEWNRGPHIREIDPLVSEFLNLLDRILRIDAEAIQESALHGLNEFYAEHLKLRIARIVDEYLSRNNAIKPELRKYALLCRDGEAQ